MLRTQAISSLALALALAAPAAAQWSTTNLSTARSNVACATVGDLTLFAGGRVGSTVLDVVDLYDSTSGTWSVAALSAPRANVATAVLGDLVFFAGGLQSFGVASDVVDVFDASTSTWSTASLSQARASIGATAVGNRVLFAGGSGIGLASNVVDVYDANVGAPSHGPAWSTQTLSAGRGSIAAATVGDLALFAGGAGIGGATFDVVDVYDDTTGTWSTASLSIARLVGNAVGVVGTRAYFAGGHFSQGGGPNMSDALDVYDAQTGLWTSATLPSPRGYLAVTSLGNNLYFAGGYGHGFTPSDVVAELNVGTGRWDTTQRLSQATATAATTVGSRALFVGANTGIIDVYEPVGISYCHGAPNSSGHAATISVSGSRSVASNLLTLTARDLPPQQFGYFLASQVRGHVAQPAGSQGDLCLGGSIGRYDSAVFASGAAGVGTLQLDLTRTPTPTGLVTITAGESWNFQAWYRDANPLPTNNFSDAVTVLFE